MHKTAQQIMTTNVVSVSSDNPLDSAFATMRRFKIRHLPVVDTGRLVGILSWGDILLNSDAADPTNGMIRIHALTVADAMTRNVITCFPSSEVADIAATMVACKIDSMPVVQGQRLVGILTTTDLLDVLCRADEVRSGRVKPLETNAWSSNYPRARFATVSDGA